MTQEINYLQKQQNILDNSVGNDKIDMKRKVLEK